MIIQADAARIPLANDSVHAVITSPPYWGGLRKYEGEQTRPWPAISYAPMPGLPPVEIPAQTAELGHEPDPFAFVGHLLQVFRECRRALRPEGCLVVNLGDKYANGGNPNPTQNSTGLNVGTNASWKAEHKPQGSAAVDGLDSKNLLLMPWRLALAMQADGWILRSRMPGGIETEGGLEPDIVWHKAATMPESCRDRPTNDFEDVLIFSQAPQYFWDQEAGRERTAGNAHSRGNGDYRKGAPAENRGSYVGQREPVAARNMRAVWTINPEPTDEEHFAAFPVELASRLIRVATSERGCCPECGAAWERVVERAGEIKHRWAPQKGTTQQAQIAPHGGNIERLFNRSAMTTGVVPFWKTVGWRPICAHYDDLYRQFPRSRRPKRRRAEAATGSWWERVRRRTGLESWPAETAVVLDPFAGLGRTWEACRATGRRFIGLDLALPYARLAMSRNDLDAAARRRAAEYSVPKTITGPLFD